MCADTPDTPDTPEAPEVPEAPEAAEAGEAAEASDTAGTPPATTASAAANTNLSGPTAGPAAPAQAPTLLAAHATGSGGYTPSASILPLLGTFANAFPATNPNTLNFVHPPRFLGQVQAAGMTVLVIDSALELDTDGWIGDRRNPNWQPGTSLQYADGKTPLDANTIPYFVLPLPTTWSASFSIHLGDYAAVLFNGQLAFAVFGDFGPHAKIGEGSVELLRRLGQERVRSNGTVINAGTEPGVLTIVFPGSGHADDLASERTLLAAITSHGQDLFTRLGGRLSA